jgi:hypothetical protein
MNHAIAELARERQLTAMHDATSAAQARRVLAMRRARRKAVKAATLHSRHSR